MQACADRNNRASPAQRGKLRQRSGHPPDSLPAPSRDSPEAACEACLALASQCRPFPAWRPRAGWTSSSTRSSSLWSRWMLEAGKVVLDKTLCFSHFLPTSQPSHTLSAQEQNCLVAGAPWTPTQLPQGGAGPLALISSLSAVQKDSLLSCRPQGQGPGAQAAQTCF